MPLWAIMYGMDALSPRVLAIAVMVLAAWGVAGWIGILAHRLWRVMRGHTAIATVVEVISEQPWGRRKYIPVVEFVTRDGQRRTGVSLKDALNRKPRIGERVRIIYSPRNPRWAIMPRWILTVALMLGSILIAGFAIGASSRFL